jgi:hypothetical protein
VSLIWLLPHCCRLPCSSNLLFDRADSRAPLVNYLITLLALPQIAKWFQYSLWTADSFSVVLLLMT